MHARDDQKDHVQRDPARDLIQRIAQLAQRHPRIQELDINPFLAGADRDSCKALDVRIKVGF